LASETDLSDIKIMNILRISITVIFSIFLILYISIFLLLVKKLKKDFPDFYEDGKNKIYIINGIIFLSLCLRVIINIIIITIYQELVESFNKETWLFPLILLA
jgi:hypothetical protein